LSRTVCSCFAKKLSGIAAHAKPSAKALLATGLAFGDRAVHQTFIFAKKSNTHSDRVRSFATDALVAQT